MRTANHFIVELEKPINDTITTESGLELYIDTRFEGKEFEHRVTEGPVVSTPFKHDTGVEVGDTLYFHHLVVMQGGQVLTEKENTYFVNYSPEAATNNQAIAYKNSKGEIIPLAGWTLLEPVEEEKTDSIIEVVTLNEKLPTKGRVAFSNAEIEDHGLKVGDVVGFKENRDYRIKVDGRELYRTRLIDLLYVEEVHND